ncbi:MAG: hypothetical protein Q7S53_00105 [bacterium]|nr:hypothetical protein [bacterium]
MSSSTIEYIVMCFLKTNKRTGLYNKTRECACGIDDLMPCENPQATCRAGYKVMCTPDCDHNGRKIRVGESWHVQPETPRGVSDN